MSSLSLCGKASANIVHSQAARNLHTYQQSLRKGKADTGFRVPEFMETKLQQIVVCIKY